MEKTMLDKMAEELLKTRTEGSELEKKEKELVEKVRSLMGDRKEYVSKAVEGMTVLLTPGKSVWCDWTKAKELLASNTLNAIKREKEYEAVRVNKERGSK